MNLTNLLILILFATLLGACTKTIQVPTPLTEPNPTEDPIFSTLDFATPESDYGTGLAVNGSDLYVLGYTHGSLDGTNQGFADGFLRRYNGGKLWGVQFGTRSQDEALKVAMDSNGDIYVVGETTGPLGFKVGESWDTFLVKFNKDGERVWIRQFGTKNSDYAVDLAINSNNQIYVLNREGPSNFTIRKFSSGGSLLKTKSVTLRNHPSLMPRAMAIDNSSRLLVLTDWHNHPQGKDIKLFKYNRNLNGIWQKDYGTSNDEFAYDVTTDSNNNIYFTFDKQLTGIGINPGGHFVKKNANGNILYTKRLEDSSSDNTILSSINTDSNDNIYIAGNTGGSFPSFSNAGGYDIVVFKYDGSGTQQWVTQFGNRNYGSTNSDIVSDIAVGDAVYVTGKTLGNLLGRNTSYGGWDAYVAQLDKDDGTILGVDQ